MTLLMSTSENSWLMVFIPTIIMVASLPFWFWRKLPNWVFKVILNLGMFGYIALIFFLCSSSRDDISSPGIMGGIFIAVIVLVANAFQYLFYNRTLNNNRCPQCHRLNLKVVNKYIEKYITTHTTIYRNNETGKKYNKESWNTDIYTTYTLYCPDCDCLFQWTDEGVEYGSRDERPPELR